MIKAVIFDLFETLITEWGHEKYTKAQICADLGCPQEAFSDLWESLHDQQYRGELTFEEIIRLICKGLAIPVSDERIQQVKARRMATKGACFDFIHPEIQPMLKALREAGYKLAILSNCSEEEMTLLRSSPLLSLVDAVILSYETGLCKPQAEIYALAAQKLGVSCDECAFIGDGGSRELYGAQAVGMKPFRALWYISQMPSPIREQPEFPVLLTPADITATLIP